MFIERKKSKIEKKRKCDCDIITLRPNITLDILSQFTIRNETLYNTFKQE